MLPGLDLLGIPVALVLEAELDGPSGVLLVLGIPVTEVLIVGTAALALGGS